MEGFKAWLSSLRTLVLAASLTASGTIARAGDVLKIEESNPTEERTALVTKETRKRLDDFIQANPAFEDPWFIKQCLVQVQLPKINCENDINGILDLEEEVQKGKALKAEFDDNLAEKNALLLSLEHIREITKYQRLVTWLFQLFDILEKGIEPPADSNIIWSMLEWKGNEPADLLEFIRNMMKYHNKKEPIPSGSLVTLAWYLKTYIELNGENVSLYEEGILQEFRGKMIPPEIQENIWKLVQQNRDFSEAFKHILSTSEWRREWMTKYRDPRFASI